MNRSKIRLTWTCCVAGGLLLGASLISGSVHAAPASGSAEQAGPADGFVGSIGVNIHLGFYGTPYYSSFSTVILPAIKALGVRNLRDSGYVYTSLNWQTQHYIDLIKGVKASTGIDLKFDLIMSPSNCANIGLALPQNVALWLPTLNIGSFEGINEGDTSPPCTNVSWDTAEKQFQTALYKAVKANAKLSNVPVYGPSLVNSASAAKLGSLASALDHGNMHPYPGGGAPTNAASQRTLWTAVNGSKPYVATETGYHNYIQDQTGWVGVSEAASGKYIPRLLLNYFNAGVTCTYLYELIDDPYFAKEEAHFGLLRSDGSAKPVYTSIQNMITLLSDRGTSFTPGSLTYTLANAPATYGHTLLQKHDGTYWLAIWNETLVYNPSTMKDIASTSTPVTVTLKTAASIEIFDPSLGTQSTWSSSGKVSSFVVSLTDRVLLVRIAP